MQQKRYIVRVIEYSAHLQKKINLHSYDLEEEFSSIKEAQNAFDTFKGLCAYICLYDKISNKSQEIVDEILNNKLWRENLYKK